MPSLIDLANRLKDRFNRPIQAQGIGRRAPINYPQTFQNVRQQIPQVFNRVSNYQIPSSVIPFGGPAISQMRPTFTPRDIYNFVAPIVQAIPRSGYEAMQTLNQDYNVHTPQGFQKFVLGAEPLRNFNDPARPSGQFAQAIGMPQLTAPIAVGAAIASDIPFIGGTNKSLSKAVLKSKSIDEFTNLLAKDKNLAKEVSVILKDTRNPLNTIEDIYNTTKQNVFRSRVNPGNYTNVRANDNPLVLGKDWRTLSKQEQSNFFPKAVSESFRKNDFRAVQQFQETFDPGFTKVTKKVNFWDYFYTPTTVLEKIGLGKQAKFLRAQYETYLTQLPKEIESLRILANQVPGQESSMKIFQYLDGKTVTLTPKELEVAGKIKTYLADWADKLKLPRDKRVSNYITHIFEKGVSQAEFNDEIAKLIDQKVAGSVYDPFLQSRKNNDLPYVQDVWRALDAYVKRAVRKYHMDPALQSLAAASNDLELLSYKYVQNLTDRINMRPTNLDTLIDNWIKSIPGIGYKFGQRPTTAITQSLRKIIYRGTLGLNVSSAMRNLSQAANTYSELGERWTATGYINLARKWNTGELEQVGVLRDSFIQDRQLSITKRFIEKFDEGLFYLFSKAEKINRGAAYFGAKARALNKGMSEQEAIQSALEVVRKTQFQFGSIDTPAVLSSDIMKSVLQLQSYNVKQLEFLKNKVVQKDIVGIIRYVGATLAMGYGLKEAFGIKLDLLPMNFSLTPSLQLTKDMHGALFGNDQDKAQARRDLPKDFSVLVPGGAQIRKTFQGITDFNKGYNEAPAGGIRYPIEQNTQNKLRGAIFGASSFPEAQEYYDTDASVLGKNQTEALKKQTDKISFYRKIIEQRAQEREIEKAKLEGGGTVGNKIITLNGDTIDLAPPTRGLGIAAFVNQNWQYTTARQLYKNREFIEPDELEAAYRSLGVDPKDVQYDYFANHTNDIKTQFIQSQNFSHDTLLKYLEQGRAVSVSGSKFASDGVIDNLRDEGEITEYEAKVLKAIKLDSRGKPIAKKGRKKSIGRISIGKVQAIKPKTFKLSRPKKPTIKIAKNTFKLSKPKAIKKFRVQGIKTKFSRRPTLG